MIGTPEAGDFLEPLPAASESRSRSDTYADVELPFVERAFDDDRLEVVGDDVLGERRIAADVPLGRRVQHLGVEHADDVAQVEIAIGELGHILAAHVAQITFVAFGHG